MNEILDKLKDIFKISSTKLITYNELDLLPIMVWQIIDERVKFRRIPTKIAGQLLFETLFDDNGTFPSHHNDCKKTIVVMEGSIRCNDGLILNEGDHRTYYKGVRHSFESIGKARLYVELNKY